ncbi:enoyl-CoA hydratase/isomerase family protein [Arthrobacter sp. ISL-28]|uniref:enoyl-CoA hydratase/isomerase family protein n=1 Tax=Arthrobacter sp. ISL-28 TaxID=2819108 RepID=UPI001BEAF298|nr:enoyl-CoA hydratase-related protein [Arthrobacter sp. ISL-28]MBT2523319.1 enoyl-CoA hydratase/isomerase family protein [Arthrobacter sp. ISL-28]
MGTILIDRPLSGVVRLTFNRPERLNAVDAAFISEFRAAMSDIATTLTDRVVILRGSGRGFCSGMDQTHTGYEHLTAEGDLDGLLQAQQDVAHLVLEIRALPQPVIAAVKGAAVGAGFAFALASDIRVAGESAGFAIGANRIGLSGADMGMTWLLPRFVGASRAAEWLLTGRKVGAAEADAAGLASRVVPDEELDAAALDTAEQILRNQDFAVRLTKRAIWGSVVTADLLTAINFENQTQALAAGQLIRSLREVARETAGER